MSSRGQKGIIVALLTAAALAIVGEMAKDAYTEAKKVASETELPKVFDHTCGICQGRGKVLSAASRAYDPEDPQNLHHTPIYETCYKCNGTGVEP
jgi:hypothetical protein